MSETEEIQKDKNLYTQIVLASETLEEDTKSGKLHSFEEVFEDERASYNGSIEASQASDVGSIPIARSKFRGCMENEYKIPLAAWSATDYAYLVNNQLGWVSDDERFWVFDSEDKMKKFREYLGV